jgi:hypothetical protein
MEVSMRTTLDIDDEVLMAAKELARRESKTAGQVISELARRAMTQHVPASAAQSVREPEAFYGFQPFASRGAVVSNDQIDRLRDDEGI